MLGGVWAPNKSLSIYANTGQAYAPASARVSGTPEPEKSSQVEIGVKKQFVSGRVQTTFAVYEIERENIAIPDANGVTQFSSQPPFDANISAKKIAVTTKAAPDKPTLMYNEEFKNSTYTKPASTKGYRATSSKAPPKTSSNCRSARDKLRSVERESYKDRRSHKKRVELYQNKANRACG